MGCTMRLRALMNLKEVVEMGGGCKEGREEGKNEHTDGERWQERMDVGVAKQTEEERLQGLRGLLQHRGQRPASHPGLAPDAPASHVTHQLLTCRIVSPVSWASCFFCSSEGYGCYGHQQESPCCLAAL